MGDLHLDPICDECGVRHSVIDDCRWLMTAAKDDPRDPAYEPRETRLVCPDGPDSIAISDATLAEPFLKAIETMREQGLTFDMDKAREAYATQLLNAEYAKENMTNQAVDGLQGGFINRRDRAAVRAIMKALS